MPGWLSNGAALVGPATVNGVAQTPPNGLVPEIDSRFLVSADTEYASGQQPQTVAATIFNMVALASELAANTATSTAGAATLNTRAGTITTESLSTAVGGTYSFVLTNSLITASGPVPQVAIYSKSNTTAGMVPISVTNAAGSATIVFQNQGSAALNGTMIVTFHV